MSCKWVQTHQVYLNAMPSVADIHGIKEMQKLRKYLASKSKAKLAWALPNAARYSLLKKSLALIAWVKKARKKTYINVYGKNYRKFAWVENYPREDAIFSIILKIFQKLSMIMTKKVLQHDDFPVIFLSLHVFI